MLSLARGVGDTLRQVAARLALKVEKMPKLKPQTRTPLTFSSSNGRKTKRLASPASLKTSEGHCMCKCGFTAAFFVCSISMGKRDASGRVYFRLSSSLRGHIRGDCGRLGSYGNIGRRPHQQPGERMRKHRYMWFRNTWFVLGIEGLVAVYICGA